MADLVRVTTTQERLREAMDESGKKQSDLANETGLNRSVISRCVNGLVEPDQRTVFKLAKTLNVSEMWLWGYDVSKERTSEQKKNDSLSKAIATARKNGLIEDVSNFMALFEQNPEQYHYVAQLISGLVNK